MSLLTDFFISSVETDCRELCVLYSGFTARGYVNSVTLKKKKRYQKVQNSWCKYGGQQEGLWKNYVTKCINVWIFWRPMWNPVATLNWLMSSQWGGSLKWEDLIIPRILEWAQRLCFATSRKPRLRTLSCISAVCRPAFRICGERYNMCYCTGAGFIRGLHLDESSVENLVSGSWA